MLKQARSTSNTKNPGLQPLERADGETNTQWGERAVRDMATGGPKEWTYVVLLGGSDTLSFRLRVAQSHLRTDMLPSYWSDSILIQLNTNTVVNAGVIDVPLIQPEGPAFAARTNGVVLRPIKDFDEPARFPNIALIALPVPQAEVLTQVESFRNSRPTLDALEHVLRWLAFAWGAARTANPLHENYGLPSACMLETVCAAANFDLAPGLEARAACPEAIWAAAGYWQKYFEQFSGRAPTGRYWTPHEYTIVEPPEDAKLRPRGKVGKRKTKPSKSKEQDGGHKK